MDRSWFKPALVQPARHALRQVAAKFDVLQANRLDDAGVQEKAEMRLGTFLVDNGNETANQ